MQVGSLLNAPEGFHSLEKDIDYFLLRSSRVTKKVLLLTYSPFPTALANLIVIDSDIFERGVGQDLIVERQTSGLPPHLDGLEGKNLQALDMARTRAVRSHHERVNDRLLKIAPLLEREDEILNSPDPERMVNVVAESNGHNAQRLRTWFFTYLCFGRDMWTLYPRFFRAGKWDRLNRKENRKLGRSSRVRGALAGANLTANLVAMIIASYRKHARLGRTLTSIYRVSMVNDFKAVTTTDTQGNKRLVSSGHAQIPSFDQYRYQVHKHVGQAAVQETLYGAQRFRRRNAPHLGMFASAVSNLCEAVEFDGYYTEDRPIGYVDQSPLPAVCVVRGVDTVSAMRLAVGFAYAKEDAQGYDSARFCMAISKKKYCSLFNIDIEDHEWPSVGLPLREIIDRGPGIKKTQDASAASRIDTPMLELTPSGSGQSKAIVESSQRRRTSTEGPQTALISQLTPFKMAQREIRRLLAENQSSNARARLTPEMLQADIFPTPIGIWKFLDERGRTDAQMIPFDQAVRKYLKSLTVRVDRQGVHLHHQRYDSGQLRDTGFLSKISRIGPRELTAYIYPFSIRYIWVEVENRIIEVEAQLSLRDDPDQLFRSYQELCDEQKTLNDAQIMRRQHSHAAHAEQLAEFEHAGDSWHSEKRKSAGRMKSVKSSADNREAKLIFEGRSHE